ncbi:enolase [Halobacteriales archaeon QS_5_70_15]|nr:MAG: enolase [Halobacteriales archaeon QS_5_70_15]
MTDEPDYRIAAGGGVPWRDLSIDESHRPPERDVEITNVETMAVAGNFTWGIVKVETDAGVYGLGETFRAEAALDMAERLLVDLEGENPLDIDRITSLMNQRYTGSGRIGQAAFTGIETACWDVKGKVLDVPLYELLGGKYRDEVKVYCDTHGGESLGEAVDRDPQEVYTPESYAMAARAAARRLDNASVDHKVSLVEAVREEIGYDVDLGMDLHWNFTVETASRIGKKLEPYDLAWLEDPVPPEQVEAHRHLRETLDLPILTGENHTTASRFSDLANAGAMDIAAPDVNKCGGLWELRKIALVCDLEGIPLAPHDISSPLGTVAGAHVCATFPNFLSLEYHARDVPWWEDLVRRVDDPGAPILEDGYIDLPEGPGLGVELDPEVAERYLTDGSRLFV